MEDVRAHRAVVRRLPGPLRKRRGRSLLVASEPTAALRRLLILSHDFHPVGNAPASRMREMGRRWVEAGCTVTVITSTPGVETEVEGIEVIRVPTVCNGSRSTLGRILNLGSFLLFGTWAGLRCRRPDLVLATSPNIFCGCAGGLLRLLRRLPLVLEIRDLWPASIAAVGAFRSRCVHAPLEVLERWMYRRADRIVTVGEGYATELRRRGVRGENISIVTNGVDLQKFTPRPTDPALRRECGMERAFVCGVVGTLGLASGLQVVLKAASLLRDQGRDDVHFALVGDGAVRAELEAEAEALGLTTVHFLGSQPKNLVPQYLAMMDCCLVHLRRDRVFEHVLPSKIFEAAAMEKPIVLGVRGCAAELLEAAQAGVAIEPENAEELAVAVTRLAEDPEQGAAFGRAGRAYMHQFYDRDVLAEDYLKVVQDVWLETQTCP